ncbi:Hpt domain-containing protein [Rhizobium helianthi]|uniref:Hpt domain-containing protein n=1 Tax=Rhizobium helianthi TaxID=1132695 RepID=A0ABW4M0H2_9HYPH
MANLSIAFEVPTNETCNRMSTERPIDFTHLATQTMGDKELETEILQLYMRQARCALQELAGAEGAGLGAIAHRLKSAASAVGAFRVAAQAEALEAHPEDAAILAGLGAAVIEAENFILKLMR